MIHTAFSSACLSLAERVAHAAMRFSPRAAREAISFAREMMAESIPLIAAQLSPILLVTLYRRKGTKTGLHSAEAFGTATHPIAALSLAICHL